MGFVSLQEDIEKTRENAAAIPNTTTVVRGSGYQSESARARRSKTIKREPKNTIGEPVKRPTEKFLKRIPEVRAYLEYIESISNENASRKLIAKLTKEVDYLKKRLCASEETTKSLHNEIQILFEENLRLGKASRATLTIKKS